MVVIQEVRARRNNGYPNVEVTVTHEGVTKYLHIAEADGEHYTVSTTSIFDYMTSDDAEEPIDLEFEEEYDDWDSCTESRYVAEFEVGKMLYDIF